MNKEQARQNETQDEFALKIIKRAISDCAKEQGVILHVETVNALAFAVFTELMREVEGQEC